MTTKSDVMASIASPDAVIGNTNAFNTSFGVDLVNSSGHNLRTGDGPIRMTTSGTLPAGLALATDYFVIEFDAASFKVASSLVNALAGVAIDITDNGTGSHNYQLTNRGLINAIEKIVTDHLAFPGNRVMEPNHNVDKLWTHLARVLG